MYVDTHVHLDEFEAEGGTEEVLQRAREAGVERMLAVGGNPEANETARMLALRHPDAVWAAVGLDRDQAGCSPDEPALSALLDTPEVRAVGEIGLDYYYQADSAAVQRRLFERMLALAHEHGLPVMVHSRDAEEDTLALLRAYAAPLKCPERAGALHCFTGSRRMAKALLDLGFLISFSGIITFSSAGELRDIATYVPEDRLLIETDTPYLAPVPHRGKRNEPAYVVRVAEKLAECRGVDPEHLARVTSANAMALLTRPRMGRGVTAGWQ